MLNAAALEVVVKLTELVATSWPLEAEPTRLAG